MSVLSLSSALLPACCFLASPGAHTPTCEVPPMVSQCSRPGRAVEGASIRLSWNTGPLNSLRARGTPSHLCALRSCPALHTRLNHDSHVSERSNIMLCLIVYDTRGGDGSGQVGSQCCTRSSPYFQAQPCLLPDGKKLYCRTKVGVEPSVSMAPASLSPDWFQFKSSLAGVCTLDDAFGIIEQGRASG